MSKKILGIWVLVACFFYGGLAQSLPQQDEKLAGQCPPHPVLENATVFHVPVEGGDFTFGENEDVQLIMPGEPVVNTIEIFGGRKVWVCGGMILLDNNVPDDQNKRALGFVATAEPYVEGLYVDVQDRCDVFTLRVNDNNLPFERQTMHATFVNNYTQNNNYNKVIGANNRFNCHGDIIQFQGETQREARGGFHLVVYNMTSLTKAQGYFLPHRLHGNTSVSLTNVNVRLGENGKPRYDIWKNGLTYFYFSGKAASDTVRYPVTLDNVWAEWSKDDRNISPGPATGTQRYVNFSDPVVIRFLPGSNIVGEIKYGRSPNGQDFVDPAKVGLEYDRSAFCNN